MINNHHSTGIFSFKGGASGWPHSIIFLYAHLNVQLVDKNPEEDQKDASNLENHIKYKVISSVFDCLIPLHYIPSSMTTVVASHGELGEIQ